MTVKLTAPDPKQPTRRPKTRLIRATLTADEGARFDDLVQASRLSQAEYMRRACLRQRQRVVPDQNLQVYATLGTLQRAIQTVLKGTLADASRETLTEALTSLKATRLLLVDVDPTATEGEGETEAW